MNPLVLLSLLAACDDERESDEDASALTVHAEILSLDALSSQVLTTAVLEAETWRPLHFQQSGIVASIDVAEGDSIRAGQRLAALDLAYQDNQVAQARVQLRAAEVDLERATRELSQAQRVAENGGYSPEQVREHEQRVEDATLNVERQRLNLKGQLIKRDQMMLHAPFDGVISEMNLQLGDRVRGEVSDPDNDRNSRPPMAAYQPGRFVARFSLPEGQAHRVGVGNRAQLTLVEDPSVSFEGTVDWVAPAVDRDNRTVAVHLGAALSTDHPSYDRIRDGSTVRIAVAGEGSDGAVLTVPEGAVVYHGDNAYVFVTDGAVARKVQVEQGRVRGGRVEVRGGVAPGDRVVTTMVYRLTDGQAVQVSP